MPRNVSRTSSEYVGSAKPRAACAARMPTNRRASVANREDVQIHTTGAAIILRRSKTDQLGSGRTVSIPRVHGRLCPVTALEKWLYISGIADGPLFRPVTKSGRAAEQRISAEAVARIIKKRPRAVGCDPSRYSGHSLRAGFATSAAVAGLPMWLIKRQTGHISDSGLDRYIRESEPVAKIAAVWHVTEVT